MWYMNEDRELIQQAAREFVEQEVVPALETMEVDGIYPTDLLKRCGELGFTGLPYPESVGGSGADWTTWCIALEEIGKEDQTLGVLLAVNTAMSGVPVYFHGSEDLRQKYLRPVLEGKANFGIIVTEPVGIFNFAEHTTRAVLDGDEWVINGAKIFTTSADASDINVVVAMTDDFDPATNRGISYFIVPADAPGFSVGHIENKIGWHPSRTGETFFKDVRIPKENLIGEEGNGFAITFDFFKFECLGFGALALGSCEKAYQTAMDYCKQRVQGGVSLYDAHESMRVDFAELRAEIEALRGYVYSIAANVDNGEDCLIDQLTIKYKAVQVQEHVTSECITLMGGLGVVNETGLAVHFRDAKVNAVGGGSVKSVMGTVGAMI